MANKEEVLEYDDNEAIDYIYEFLDKDDRKEISKDDILFVLAMMGEYYEKQGLISEDEEGNEVVSEAEIDEDEIFQFIMEKVQEDEQLAHLTGDLVDQILEGEYQYGLSTGLYEEDEE